MPQPRIEVYPTSLSDQIEVMQLWYLAQWIDLGQNEEYAQIPDYCENLLIELVRSMSPETPIIARARYHRYRSELLRAGAHAVVDEEEEVGLRMTAALKKVLRVAGSPDDARPTHTAQTGSHDPLGGCND